MIRRGFEPDIQVPSSATSEISSDENYDNVIIDDAQSNKNKSGEKSASAQPRVDGTAQPIV